MGGSHSVWFIKLRSCSSQTLKLRAIPLVICLYISKSRIPELESRSLLPLLICVYSSEVFLNACCILDSSIWEHEDGKDHMAGPLESHRLVRMLSVLTSCAGFGDVCVMLLHWLVVKCRGQNARETSGMWPATQWSAFSVSGKHCLEG